ncbi:MAG: hypothetical protein ABSG15_13315 [FCB group bacterium]|jgi:hypothetical protein
MKQEIKNLIFKSIFVVLAVRILGAFIYDIYDDAFITFRYALNFATNKGFVYNYNELILGTTSPAFGLLISLMIKIGLPIPVSIVTLNIIIDIAIAVIILVYLLKENKNIESCIFILFFASSPLLSRICCGGMEVNLFLFFSLISIYLYNINKIFLSIFICSLNYFIRPEAVTLLVVIVLYEFFISKKSNSFKMAILSLVTISMPLVLIYYYYGNILPQSVQSKATLIGDSVFSVINSLLLRDLVSCISVPFAIIGIIKIKKLNSFFRIFGYWLILLFLSYVIARPLIWTWYSESIRVGIAVFASFGLSDILSYVPKFSKFLSFNRILIFSLILALSLNLFIGFKFGFSLDKKYIYNPVELWCRENITQNNVLLADDIGVIGFYFKGYIIDTQGLISDKFIKKEERTNYIFSKKPDYLFINSCRDNIIMLFHSKLENIYTPLMRFSKYGITSISKNPNDYQSGWVQDYILFKRN